MNLGVLVSEVDDVLRNILSKYLSEAGGIHGELRELVSSVSEYTLRGGKRLRAILIALGYLSRGIVDLEPIKELMASIEFLQSYLLVHDDVMDRDEVRRGGPTLHAFFRDKCINQGFIGDCNHYGVSQAIVAGDYLESIAIGAIANLSLKPEVAIALIKRYSEGLRAVAYGQYLDVLMANKSLREVKATDVLKVHELKTASYTVELPLHLGVIARDPGDRELLSLYSDFSKPAGIAFQLRDDILGLYGDPRVTGKPVGSDVRERKKTLLVVKAYELGDVSDRKILEEIYDSRREVGLSDVKSVQEVVKRTGSLSHSEELIKEMYFKAREVIEYSKPIDPVVKQELLKMLEKLVFREK